MGSDTELDVLDRGLLHALQIDPRLPFRRIAEVLGVSDQTVARRYRRLRADSAIAVVALPDPWQVGQAPWLVRLRCVPSSAAGIAAALAGRPEIAWLHLLSGGAEIDATVLPRAADQDTLLLQRLTRTSGVMDVSAHSVLRILPASREHVLDPVLTPDQVAALRPDTEPDADPPTPRSSGLSPADNALLAELRRDARAPLARLATATGWSESAARRRLAVLRRQGMIFFEVDVDPARFGYAVQTRLWITAAPADLASVGEAVSRHPLVPFTGVITGPSNLVAIVYSRTPADLYGYLTGELGRLPGIQQVETAPIVRSLKRAGRVTS